MTAWISNGATIAVGDGASPEVFTTIGEVLTIDGPKESRPVIDTSTLSSSIRTGKVGLRDGGTVSVTCHLDPATTSQDTVYTHFTAATATEKNYRITLTDTAPAETITFSAIVQEYGGPEISIDETIKLSFTLKVISAPTYA